MKQKLRYLIGLAIVVVVVIVGLKILASRGPRQGVLKVDSSPAASVFLGNKHLGRTPFEEKVDAGNQAIRIVPESSTDSLGTWQGTVTIAPNLLTYVNTILSDSDFSTAVDMLWLEKIPSKQSDISVTSNPDGSMVLLDGDTKGVTPLSLTDIPAGDHTLTLSSPGFIPRTLKIKTTSGYKLFADLKLALSSQSQAPNVASPSASPSPTSSQSPTPTSKTTIKPTPTTTKQKSASSSASLQTPATPYITIKETPTGYLNVRIEAGSTATKVSQVNPGEKYHVLDEAVVSGNTWYQITYNGADKGWVSGQYADKTE